MEFGIQVGNRLQGVTSTLAKSWGYSTVVLSPRTFRMPKSGNLEEHVAQFSGKLKALSSTIMFDPIMYTEENALRQLKAMPYFQVSSGNLESNYRDVIASLMHLNDRCGIDEVILPSHTLNEYVTAWNEKQRFMVDFGARMRSPSKIIPTIALAPGVVKDSSAIEAIGESVHTWGVTKVYLVCEHPQNYYLVDDPHWLANIMRLVAWLKLSGVSVLMGYASHQMLTLAMAKCDAIFAGGFLNMRRFYTEDFRAADTNAPSRRSIWYYCPHVLSEYKLVTLDIAYEKGVLGQLRTPLDREYANPVFDSGVLPSSTAYNETSSFLHYLECLRGQCAQLAGKSYDAVRAYLESSFSVAEEAIQGLRDVGIHDRDRSFASALSASEQAIAAFHDELGFSMSQLWDTL